MFPQISFKLNFYCFGEKYRATAEVRKDSISSFYVINEPNQRTKSEVIDTLFNLINSNLVTA